MTIAYPLTMPTNVSPSSMQVYTDTIVGLTVSPFSFQQNIQQYDGERWRIDIALPALSKEQAGEWIGFLAALRGAYGSFYAPIDSVKTTPYGVATGTPQVNGSNAAGNIVLNTKGWTNSITNILKAGDYIQINNSVYMVLQNVNSGAGGLSTLDVFPRLRETLTDSTSIITEAPKCVFRLGDNTVNWGIAKDKTYLISFSGVEFL